ncbi:hypothetical protein ABK040_000525 [Willaertia magna]
MNSNNNNTINNNNDKTIAAVPVSTTMIDFNNKKIEKKTMTRMETKEDDTPISSLSSLIPSLQPLNHNNNHNTNINNNNNLLNEMSALTPKILTNNTLSIPLPPVLTSNSLPLHPPSTFLLKPSLSTTTIATNSNFNATNNTTATATTSAITSNSNSSNNSKDSTTVAVVPTTIKEEEKEEVIKMTSSSVETTIQRGKQIIEEFSIWWQSEVKRFNLEKHDPSVSYKKMFEHYNKTMKKNKKIITEEEWNQFILPAVANNQIFRLIINPVKQCFIVTK